jgi:hypothetical protein
MEDDSCESELFKGKVGEGVMAGEAGRRKSWGADCCRAWCGAAVVAEAAIVVEDIKSLL